MSPTITVVIIPAEVSAPVRAEQIEPNLSVLQKLIGGYIERVPGGPVAGADGNWHAYVDEEGKLKQLPVNARATALMHLVQGIHVWDHINGDLVIVGITAGGEESDAPEGFTAPNGLMEFWNCDTGSTV